MIRTWFLLLMSLLSSTSGNVMLKGTLLSLETSGAPQSTLAFALALMGSPYFWLGLFLYGTGFLFWIRVLAVEEVSRVYPIGASLSFLLILTASSHFFGEDYSNVSILGVVLICAGIVLCGKGSSQPGAGEPG